jgi:hypothetical protein
MFGASMSLCESVVSAWTSSLARLLPSKHNLTCPAPGGTRFMLATIDATRRQNDEPKAGMHSWLGIRNNLLSFLPPWLTRKSLAWLDCLIRRPACWAVFAFLVGFARHYLPYISWPDRFLFGDLTDGYFNLWVLEHTRTFLSTGNLHEYLHTRCFVPGNNLVLFWSDVLFFPSLLYSFLHLFTGNVVVVFNLTVLVLIAAGFWIAWDFFRTLYIHAICPSEHTLLPPGIGVAIALLAYVTTFSDSRVMFTAHFQNQMANFVLLGVSCALRYAKKGTAIHLGTTMGVWLLLCYSTPYYALVLSMLLACFLVLYVKTFRLEVFTRQLKARGWIVLTAFVMVLPVAVGYIAVRSPYSSQAETSSEFWHILLPDASTRLATFLHGMGCHVPYRTHESLAYAGFFIVPVLLGLFFWQGWRILPGHANEGRLFSLLGLGAAAGIAAWSIPHGSSGLAFSLIAAICTFVAVVLIIRTTRGRLVPIWLFLALVLCYGTALGPAVAAPLRPFNPSLWGIMATIVPAYDSIRAVGRFGALGFSFALGLGWYVALSLSAAPLPRRNRLAMIALLGVTALSAIVDVPRPAYCHQYDFKALTPTPDETAFFAANPSRILVLPANNLSLIPGHMIYFEQLPTTELVNGYSGRFTSLVERLQVSDNNLTPELILRAISESKATHLVLDKRAFSGDAMDRIAAEYGGTIRLENAAYRLLALSPR